MDSNIKKALALLVEKAIYGNKENNRGSIFEAEKTIKQALTPPTAEEVCEAILDSDNGITKVEYRFNNVYGKMDFLIYEGSWNSWVSDWGMLSLPPRIVKLIGRFYEGLK